MKKLASFDDTFILEKIYKSKKLSNWLSDYIEESEMNYIQDILSCFSGCNYLFILYGTNFIDITNSSEFLHGVEKAIHSFGGTDKIEKLLATANKLKNNNLFDYKVEQVKNAVFEWLNSICEHTEKLIDKIYSKEIDDDVINYLECFVDNYLNDVYVNNENKLVRLETL